MLECPYLPTESKTIQRLSGDHRGVPHLPRLVVFSADEPSIFANPDIHVFISPRHESQLLSVGRRLPDLYLRGEGVQQDDAQAFAWFQKAAAQGHTGARIKLGFLYMTGRGVSKDPESAYVWILAASLAGDPRGQKYLNQLGKVLSAEQLAEARERAEALSIAEHRIPETAFVR